MAGSFTTEATSVGTGLTRLAVVTANPWARVHTVPTPTDGGVDFELRMHDEFPILANEGQPVVISSGLTLGNP